MDIRYITTLLFFTLGFFSFSQPALSQTASASQESSLELSLADLDFLRGKWVGTFLNDREYEKYWTGLSGNTIMGMLRFIRDDDTMLFEILAIEESDTGPVLRVKHFTPGLIGRQERENSDLYRLIETGPNRALFESEDGNTLLDMRVQDGDKHLVRRGRLEDGEWNWADLFVGNRTEL